MHVHAEVACLSSRISVLRLIIIRESNPVLFTIPKSNYRNITHAMLALLVSRSLDISAGSVAATQMMPILVLTDTPLAHLLTAVHQHGTGRQTHS